MEIEIGDRMQAMTLREINNKYESSNVRWGRAKTQTLSTELDSSIIVISNSDKLDIQCYDIVELLNEQGQYEYWLVADKQESYITFTAPFKFQYTIQLMSLTKLLETSFLPSMTITNIGQNRTILFYIEDAFRNSYFKSSQNIPISISDRLQTLANVVAKEHTFSEPTIREFIDWLLSSVGAICTLKMTKTNNHYSFVLDYIKLSASSTQIGNYITNIETGQDSEAYVSRILQTSDDIVSEQTITEYLKEATTEPIFNTDTAQLILKRKAFDFKNLKVLNVGFRVRLQHGDSAPGTSTPEVFTTYNSDNDSDVPSTISISIADLVVPTEEYSTLNKPKPSAYESSNPREHPGNCAVEFYTTTSKKWLTNTLTWDRGKSVITNIHYMQEWKEWWDEYNTGTSIENAIRRKIWEWFKTTYPNKGDSYVTAGSWQDDEMERSVARGLPSMSWWLVDNLSYEYDEQLFEVEYQPYFSPKIVEQSERRNAIYSVDTNTNAKTDILLQLDRNKEKLNQLACDYKIMTAISKVTNDDYTPKISVGQYWLDENNKKYILTKLETAVNPSFIQYKGTLSLNFSNAIIDTSLNREKRYYAYANTEIVTRKESITYYYKIELNNYNSGDRPLMPANYCRIEFLADGTPYRRIGYYILPVVAIYNDRMASFEIQTMDNISITSVKGDSITGGYQNKVLKYVDDYGEFAYANVELGVLDHKGFEGGKTAIEWAAEIDISECGDWWGSNEDIFSDMSDWLFFDLTPKIDVAIDKDNREKINITAQFIAKTSVDIPNSTAYFNAFYFDRYLDNLKQYYEAVNASDNPSSLTKPFTWTLTWLSGRAEQGVTKQGDVTLDELFSTNFMSIYTASGGQYANDDNIRLRISCNYSGSYTIDIRNYKGGYLTPSYEDFK